MSDELYAKLCQSVVDGEPEDAERLARQALAEGLDPLDCIDEALTPGIDRVGELFETGEYFLPDLIIGADAMKAALGVLEPVLLKGRERKIVGRVVLGTVKGDLHEIGKTLVGTMLTANGFEVTDLGVDVPADEFVAAVKETGAPRPCSTSRTLSKRSRRLAFATGSRSWSAVHPSPRPGPKR